MFIPSTELLIPTGRQTNKANAEIETQPVTFEGKISTFSNHLFTPTKFDLRKYLNSFAITFCFIFIPIN